MQLDDNITIAQLKAIAQVDRCTSNFLDKVFCNSYEDFLKIIYKVLDECIEFMEENPKVRCNDSEDRLTTDIIQYFRAKGYNATHDEMIGGHVDIAIKHNNYMWLGEAKIHSDYKYLMKGFNQLCTRYSSGTNKNCNGGLIIYIRNRNAADIIGKWKTHLSERGLSNYTSLECETRQGLSFYTEHTHDRSGLPYRVRHMAVVLGFDPQDRK